MRTEIVANETLAAVGWRIRSLITKAQSANEAEQHSWLKFANEVQRFELWACNLGLYTGGHSSLDYRFRDAPLVFEYTGGLLRDLERALSQLTTRLSQNDRSDSPPASVDSDSEEEDFASYQDTPLSEILIETAIATVDKLYRLAFKVRNPAMRLGNSRALAYHEVDPETGVNLIDTFAESDKQYMRDLFYSYNPTHPDDHYLLQRLATANTRRRQQFRYWKKRREKLDRFSLAELVDEEPELARHEQNLPIPAVLPVMTVSRPSTATRLNLEEVKLDDDTSMISTTSFIHIDNDPESDSISLPPPPIVKRDGKEFECPYCFTVCPQKLLRRKAWENHILRDLRPYICTYPDCKVPDQQYDSMTDWIKHETLFHRTIGEQVRPNNPDGIADSKIPPEEARDCPFCLKHQASPSHIASHLQRIASFSLPRSTGDDMSTDGSKRSNQAQLPSGASGISSVSLHSASDGLISNPAENPPSSIPGLGLPLTIETIEQEFSGEESKTADMDRFLAELGSEQPADSEPNIYYGAQIVNEIQREEPSDQGISGFSASDSVTDTSEPTPTPSPQIPVVPERDDEYDDWFDMSSGGQ